MKLYNPFRWHITKAGPLYFVRRWSILGWHYIDADDLSYKWSSTHRNKYCAVSSLDAARKVLTAQHEEFVSSNSIVHAAGYPGESGEVLTALYTSPQPPADVPMIEPIPPEKIAELIRGRCEVMLKDLCPFSFERGVRWAEKQHGIGGGRRRPRCPDTKPCGA